MKDVTYVLFKINKFSNQNPIHFKVHFFQSARNPVKSKKLRKNPGNFGNFVNLVYLKISRANGNFGNFGKMRKNIRKF